MFPITPALRPLRNQKNKPAKRALHQRDRDVTFDWVARIAAANLFMRSCSRSSRSGTAARMRRTRAVPSRSRKRARSISPSCNKKPNVFWPTFITCPTATCDIPRKLSDTRLRMLDKSVPPKRVTYSATHGGNTFRSS